MIRDLGLWVFGRGKGRALWEGCSEMGAKKRSDLRSQGLASSKKVTRRINERLKGQRKRVQWEQDQTVDYGTRWRDEEKQNKRDETDWYIYIYLGAWPMMVLTLITSFEAHLKHASQRRRKMDLGASVSAPR